jgi:hypothetical protein
MPEPTTPLQQPHWCNTCHGVTPHQLLTYTPPRTRREVVDEFALTFKIRHELWECLACEKVFYQETTWENGATRPVPGLADDFFGPYEPFVQQGGWLSLQRYPEAVDDTTPIVQPYDRHVAVDLLQYPESDILEFKRDFSHSRLQILKTVCGFLNHRGGVLILGVEDKNRALWGIEEDQALYGYNNDKLKLAILDFLKGHITPNPANLIELSIEYIESHNRLILAIWCRNNPIKNFLVRLNHQTLRFIRTGNQTLNTGV